MCLFMIIAPIIAYMITGNMPLAAGLYFPGITEYGPILLSLLVIYNDIMIVGAASTEIPVMVLVWMAFTNVHMLACMTILEIESLEVGLETSSASSIRVQLIHIIQMNEKYNA